MLFSLVKTHVFLSDYAVIPKGSVSLLNRCICVSLSIQCSKFSLSSSWATYCIDWLSLRIH